MGHEVSTQRDSASRDGYFSNTLDEPLTAGECGVLSQAELRARISVIKDQLAEDGRPDASSATWGSLMLHTQSYYAMTMLAQLHSSRLSQAAQIRLRRQLKLYKQQLQQLMEAEKQARQEANNHAASSTAPSPVAPTPAAKPANRRLTLNNGQSLVLLGDIFTSPPTDTDTDTPTARLPIKDALAKQTRNIRFSPTAILFLSDEVFTPKPLEWQEKLVARKLEGIHKSIKAKWNDMASPLMQEALQNSLKGMLRQHTLFLPEGCHITFYQREEVREYKRACSGAGELMDGSINGPTSGSAYITTGTKSLDTRRLILDGNASEGESDSEEILVIDVLKEGGKAINTRRGKTRRSDSSALGTEDGPRSRRASSSLLERRSSASSKRETCPLPRPLYFRTMQIDMDAVEAHRALTKAHHSLEMNAIGVPFDPPRSLICETVGRHMSLLEGTRCLGYVRRSDPKAPSTLAARLKLPPRVLSCDFRSYERVGFLDEQDILDRERRRDAVLRHLGSLPGDTIMEPLHDTVNSSWEAAERRAEAMEARRKLQAAVLIPEDGDVSDEMVGEPAGSDTTAVTEEYLAINIFDEEDIGSREQERATMFGGYDGERDLEAGMCADEDDVDQHHDRPTGGLIMRCLRGIASALRCVVGPVLRLATRCFGRRSA